ncbi:Uncharacterised protein [Mycobacteroides abscessus subsp. abscessus]|nr:Uncharacterised protein [Mycobacteroides abscessus subsp. abscessus]
MIERMRAEAHVGWGSGKHGTPQDDDALLAKK